NLTAIAMVLAITTVISCKEKTEKKSETTVTTTQQTTPSTQDQFGGIALYTLREDMGKDVDGTLEEVAKAGYKNLEAAGYKDGKYYGMSPEDFKKLAASKGLSLISTHQSSATLDNADQEIARSEEHTSELQSREKLVCRLLLE